jgi:hypothetical protein
MEVTMAAELVAARLNLADERPLSLRHPANDEERRGDPMMIEQIEQLPCAGLDA